MKKILAILMGTFMVFNLVACTGGNTGNDNNTGDTGKGNETGTKKVVKFASQADSTTGTKDAIKAFNESQNEIMVEFEEFTNDSAQYHDQLVTSLSSGSPEYDVISMDVVWAGEFAAAGYVQPLDVMMSEANINTSDYNSGSMEAGNYKGKHYSLPYYADLGLLYYRKDIVSTEDATRLQSGDYTYDDLGKMAEKYMGQGGTDIGYVFQSKQYEGLTCNVTEFTGGFKDIRGGLQTMKYFVDAKWSPSDVLNYTEGETKTQFTNLKAVFARNWPYQYGTILSDDTPMTKEQVDVAPLPMGGTVGGWLLGINKSSDVSDAAWTFVQYLAGAKGQKILAIKGGYLPGLNAVVDDPEVQEQNAMLQMPGFKKALTTTISRPVSAEYAKTSDAIQVAVHKYLSGSSDLDTATTAVENSIKE